MLRRTSSLLFLGKLGKVTKPPKGGYEIAELPNEKTLAEFRQFHRSKAVLVTVYSGPMKSASGEKVNTIVQDPIMRSFITSLNVMNFGHPDEVKFALVPGPQAPRLVDEYNIIAYPTTLLFINDQCVYRTVGARARELSIKSLFMLRNNGRKVMARA